MEKFITFCKLYRTEVLFALLTILLISVFVFCWFQFNKWIVFLCGAIAICLEMCVTFFLSYLPIRNYQSFRKAHYLCFVLWSLVFALSIILSEAPSKDILLLSTVSTMAFCALFTDLAIAVHLS